MDKCFHFLKLPYILGQPKEKKRKHPIYFGMEEGGLRFGISFAQGIGGYE
jgi:hypothetical protein